VELRHLRYFLAVADAGSFLHAAERLHISQPPLSTQIKDLETELGVRLLDRSPKGVLLTPAGAAFYAEAQAILARVEHARIAAQRADKGDHGALSIGFISIADYNVLPATLKRFRAQFPDVDVQLREMTTDAQLRELASERLDVGIGLGPVEDAGVVFEALICERLLLVAPSGHPAVRTSGGVSLRTLKDDHFVMPPRPLAPGLHDFTIAFCRACGFAPQITQYASQMQTVISLVSGGFGVALVPESLRNLQRTGVRYRALQEPGPLIETGVMHRRRSTNPVVPRFVEVIRKVAGDYVRATQSLRATRKKRL